MSILPFLFARGGERLRSRLYVDTYWGDAGDYLGPSNGSAFSTFDLDYDGAPQNCAKYFHSAWWYHTYGTE